MGEQGGPSAHVIEPACTPRAWTSGALAVGRQVLEIAYYLLREPTTCRELGTDFCDRYRAERLKRRSPTQLQRLRYLILLLLFPPLLSDHFSG
jgi:hypothetical protein